MDFVALVIKKKTNVEHNENNTWDCYFNQQGGGGGQEGGRQLLTVGQSQSQREAKVAAE